MNVMEWLEILNWVVGATGGTGALLSFISRNGRKRDRADADLKIAEAQRQMIANYEERIKDKHAVIDMQNEAEKRYVERIAEQNKTLDQKSDEIHKLRERVWESQLEVNRVQDLLNEANERLIKLTEERDIYRNWHCRSAICVKGDPDPEGRQPPNPNVLGQLFPGPEITDSI